MFARAPDLKGNRSGGSSVVSPTAAIVADLKRGRMTILMDDEDRENEGDIVVAAEHVTPEHINFMLSEAHGLICLPLTEERMKALGLRMMVADNTAPLGTAFTVSMDSRRCRSGGVSAADRALTIREVVREGVKPDDFLVPGHVFPLRARDGGVLVRTGQTEGAVDLCRLAGLQPAGVICEILNADGTMARLPDLIKFGKKHDLKLGTVADLIEYRLQHETLVEEVAAARLPTLAAGEFRAHVFVSSVDEGEHLALVKGDITSGDPVLVRAHAEYPPGDVFSYTHRDTRRVLEGAMKKIAEEGCGVVLYVRRQGRGAEMLYEDEERRPSTNPNARLANFKDYGIGAQILRKLGVSKIKLLTNTKPRLPNLSGYGLEVVDVVAV